ncbi:hypothetical protein GCM10009546_69350 [Actinomadura livida]|uniref:IS3 family transposase n=1 Tax=Actinomadura livida TaxID=79909 RepID=A0ABN1FTD6_9ACTN|nr:hypothetical protein GCM10010208_73870 [Actinomadura livida]
MIHPAQQEMESLVGIKASCELTGVNRASRYRWRNPAPRPLGPHRRLAPHPAALSEAE